MSSIKCPHCQTEISLTDALAHDVLKEKLVEERAKITKVVTTELRGQLESEIADQRDRLKAEATRIKELTEVEKSMRIKVRELEDKARDAELAANRKFDEERRKIEVEAGRRASTELQRKVDERDLQIDGLRRQIEELGRKVDQGSQQAQGEVVELAVERSLAEMFAADRIDPIATGVRGADVMQTVRSTNGAAAGKISWEVKRTKHWKNEWLSKAKSDCLAANADVAVIITQAMPADVESLELIDGVYVVSFDCWRILAVALRKAVMDVHAARLAQVGRETKAAKIYSFVTGSKFKQQIDTIVRSYTTLKDQLEKEKRALAKCWSERERILSDAIETTASMHGEIQAIAGEELPEIAQLAFAEGGGL